MLKKSEYPSLSLLNSLPPQLQHLQLPALHLNPFQLQKLIQQVSQLVQLESLSVNLPTLEQSQLGSFVAFHHYLKLKVFELFSGWIMT